MNRKWSIVHNAADASLGGKVCIAYRCLDEGDEDVIFMEMGFPNMDLLALARAVVKDHNTGLELRRAAKH